MNDSVQNIVQKAAAASAESWIEVSALEELPQLADAVDSYHAHEHTGIPSDGDYWALADELGLESLDELGDDKAHEIREAFRDAFFEVLEERLGPLRAALASVDVSEGPGMPPTREKLREERLRQTLVERLVLKPTQIPRRLRSEDAAVRERAARALGRLDPEAAAAVKKALKRRQGGRGGRW